MIHAGSHDRSATLADDEESEADDDETQRQSESKKDSDDDDEMRKFERAGTEKYLQSKRREDKDRLDKKVDSMLHG